MSDYDAIAPVYDDWSAHMTEDVDFYVSLAAEAEGPVVELAVGNGRVAVPIAQRTGRRVIGIDASPEMLQAARARAHEAGVELDLRLGDMRELALDEPTDLVVCPFRSLLHLPRPGQTGDASSRASPRRSGPEDGLPGTASRSTRSSPRHTRDGGRTRTG